MELYYEINHSQIPKYSMLLKKLGIKNFRGVFQRDGLPKKSLNKECGILNLDHAMGSGTHWTAWFKNNGKKIYFDSFGLQPPLEIIGYLKSPIYYNTEQIQPRDQVFCGHLCLYVLKEMMEGNYKKLLMNYINFTLKNACQ